jgi:hypothetical protein
MMEIVFSYPHERCPQCNSRLKSYRLDRRKVKCADGEFTALHRIMICPEERIKFRSERLDLIIPPGCTYSNDVMVEGAIKRYIEGRSSSEISSLMGVSEGHARKLTNQALEIFSEIHEDNVSKLYRNMNSYILQIDGTTDSEFSMIVAVKDSVSGFVLYVKRCDSESEESVVDVLDAVKSRFGTPSGITCDMRSGILSAAGIVFPHVPVRICLMHFLRDLGKDLMKDMHTDLGILINRIGIKSHLRKILMIMPDYDQCTLYDVEYGFCLNREKMEIMAVRRIVENILSVRSSGYGFPFSLRHLNFFISCEEGMRKLAELSGRFECHESVKTAETVMKQLSRITDNKDIMDKAVKLKDINSFIFQRIRKAFMIPDHGKLSADGYDPLTDDPAVHENCTVVFGELEVYMKTDIENHLFRSAKLAIERYRNRETMLFAQNSEGTIPRTNNNMEIFFRIIRRNIRKRSGNVSTGNILKQSGEKIALFQNMDNGKYMEIVFGKDDIASVFSRHRKPFKKDGMTHKRTIELVDRGTELILDNSLSNQPYTEETFNKS